MKELYVFCSAFGAFHLSEDIAGNDKKEFKTIDELMNSLKPYYESGRCSIVARSFPKDDLELFKLEINEKYHDFKVSTKSKRDKN